MEAIPTPTPEYPTDTHFPNLSKRENKTVGAWAINHQKKPTTSITLTTSKPILENSEPFNANWPKDQTIPIIAKAKNRFFITSEKRTFDDKIKNLSFINNEIKTEITNQKFNNININETYDKINEKSLEKKYKDLLQSKIEEKNKDQRKINSEINEINKEKTLEEKELRGKEFKKANVQKANYDLENLKKLNEQKIKKLNKQLNELKIQEKNYENQIIKKEEALVKLKTIVESVNSMQQLRE